MNEYVLNDYFDWLYYTVTKEIRGKKKSYRKLLGLLHSIEFRYSVDNDENRACDGLNLRWYYVSDGGENDILKWKKTCTVLEMLIALSMKMESIMEAPGIDNAVEKWFWLMIENLDLKENNDRKYDKKYIMDRIDMFLDREYEPDGEGNIIYIENCPEDLKEVEIWSQMCWYLDSII
jgi:hypothetical protein